MQSRPPLSLMRCASVSDGLAAWLMRRMVLTGIMGMALRRDDIFRLVALAAAAILLGVVGGLIAGHDLTQRPASESPRIRSGRIADTASGAGSGAGGGDARASRRRYVDVNDIVRACGVGCSDYDIGMLWAEREGIRDAGECMAYTWSYQRGCLAYLREGNARPTDDLSATLQAH